jgi:hypothetical protein
VIIVRRRWRKWNNALFPCQKYVRERERLLLDLRSNGFEETELSELLGKSSGDVVFNRVFCFFRDTRLLGRIRFSLSLVHTPVQLMVVMHHKVGCQPPYKIPRSRRKEDEFYLHSQ